MVWRESYTTKKGIKYVARWEGKEGDNRKKSTVVLGYNAREANDTIKDMETAQAHNQPFLLNKTVAQCYAQFNFDRELEVEKEVLQANTHRITNTGLRPFLEVFGKQQILKIRLDEYQSFRANLLQNRTAGGANIVIRNVRTFINFCVGMGYLPKSPFPPKTFKEYKAPEVAQFPRRIQLAQFYKVAPKWLRRYIFVYYGTGMRREEIFLVNWDNLEDGGATVHNKDKTRFVPITKRVRRVLLSILKHPAKLNTLTSAWTTIQQKSGHKFRIHDMRHLWASICLKNGRNVAWLMKAGGWSSMEVFKIYAHFQQKEMVMGLEKFRL